MNSLKLARGPPRSCDLSPLDYVLWGYLKSKVYTNRPHTLDALWLNSERCIRGITVYLLHNVVETNPIVEFSLVHEAETIKSFCAYLTNQINFKLGSMFESLSSNFAFNLLLYLFFQ